MIEVGKKAPAFNLKDQDGVSHRLSSYAGKTVVLYFYPKDDTSGCTKQACSFVTTSPSSSDQGRRAGCFAPRTSRTRPSSPASTT